MAPDHVHFQGLTKRLVTVTFQQLSVSQRIRVGLSLRDALARSHLPSTTIYNAKRNSVMSVGISEWAAAITVFSTVLRRTLRSAPATGTLSRAAVALQAALAVIDRFTGLICGVYSYPRLELDDRAAFELRLTPVGLQKMAESFFELVRKAFLRADLQEFVFLDVPNLHCLRELMDHVIPALLHVQNAEEVLFENAHQPLKNAVVRGNGHDDAERAMAPYVEGELASRMRLDAAFFSIPESWVHHYGVRAYLLHALPLFRGENQSSWSCSGGTLDVCRVPAGAQRFALARFAGHVKWRGRATRGGKDKLQLGNAVSVLRGSTRD